MPRRQMSMAEPIEEAGVSLLELLVAVALLSIAVVGLFRVFDAGVSGAAGDRDRLLSGLIARNRAEELALGMRGLPGRVTLTGRQWLIETDTRRTSGGFDEVVLIVRPAEGGAGSRLVTYTAGGAAQ